MKTRIPQEHWKRIFDQQYIEPQTVNNIKWPRDTWLQRKLKTVKDAELDCAQVTATTSCHQRR